MSRKVNPAGPLVTISAGSPNAVVDCSKAAQFTIYLTANMGTLTVNNPTAGAFYTFYYIQDGVGGHSYTWPSPILWSDSPPTNTAANVLNVITVAWSGSEWFEVSRSGSVGSWPVVVPNGTGLISVAGAEFYTGPGGGTWQTYPKDASTVSFVVNGKSGTADLQQWKNDGVTAVAGVTYAGVLYSGTGNTALAITGGATTHTIEIGRTDGTASSPYIDFHSGATGVDYDARIAGSSGDGAVGGGDLVPYVRQFYVTGQRAGYSPLVVNAINGQTAAVADFRVNGATVASISKSGGALFTTNSGGSQADTLHLQNATGTSHKYLRVDSSGTLQICNSTFSSVPFQFSDAGALTTAGALTVSSGGAAITGNSTVTGTLNVTSTLTSGGALTVSAGGAAITGNSSITGILNVSAALNTSSGIYNASAEALLTGSGGTTQRSRFTDGGSLFYFQTDHAVQFTKPYSATWRVQINPDPAVNAVPVSIAGVSGQTGHLTDWQDNVGTVLSGVGSDGAVWAGPAGPLARLSASAATASDVPLRVRGFASQTADLLQAQDSAGTSRFRVRPADVSTSIFTPGLGNINNWGGGAYNTGYYKIQDGWLTAMAWTSTANAGTYPDPPTVQLPAPPSSSIPKTGTNMALNNGNLLGPVLGYWNYRRASDGATWSGVIVNTQQFSNQEAAMQLGTGAIFSLQPTAGDMCTYSLSYPV